jgi:hypothetical protein
VLRFLTAADAPRIHALVGSDRLLFLRVGALLQERCAATEAVLAEALGRPGLKELLLDRGLHARTADSSFAELALRHLGDDHGLAFTEASHDGRPWRVLAWSDEIGNPLLAALPAPVGNGLAALAERLPPAQARAAQALLAARNEGERCAALEQLRYSGPDRALASALLPVAFSDGSARVRGAALAVLAATGTAATALAAVRLLLHDGGDGAEVPPLAALDVADASLVIAALAAALAAGGVTPATALAVAVAIHPHLATDERLPRILDLMAPSLPALDLLSLVRRLQSVDANASERAVRGLVHGEPTSDALAIILLARPDRPLDAALRQRGLDLLLANGDEPRERLHLAAALLRGSSAPELLADLSASAPRLPRLRDPAWAWLAGELLSRAPDGADIAPLAAAVVHLLRDGQGGSLWASLDQRLPARLAAAVPAEGEALARALGDMVGRTRDLRSLDLLTDNLSQLPPSLAAVLVELALEHPDRGTRARVAAALPAVLCHSGAAAAPLIERLVAALPQRHGDEAVSLGSAAAEAVGGLTDASHGAGLARRLGPLLETLGLAAVPALGHLAAGPHAAPELRSALIDRLLAILATDVADEGRPALREEAGDDGPTFIFDARLAAHTERLPVVLMALRRIGAAAAVPQPLRQRVLDSLAERWRQVVDWSLVWAPGNVALLAESLAAIGSTSDAGPRLRRSAAEALARRREHPAVAVDLARICAAAGSALAGLAGASATAVLERLARTGGYLDDEQPDVLRVLVAWLELDDLGDDDAALRRRLVYTIGNLRRHADGRTRQRLAAVAARLDATLAGGLSWVRES